MKYIIFSIFFCSSILNNFIIINKIYYNIYNNNNKCIFKIIIKIKNNIFEFVNHKIENDLMIIFDFIYINQNEYIIYFSKRNLFYIFDTS